jgi:predicted nucleic acid-binding protein
VYLGDDAQPAPFQRSFAQAFLNRLGQVGDQGPPEVAAPAALTGIEALSSLARDRPERAAVKALDSVLLAHMVYFGCASLVGLPPKGEMCKRVEVARFVVDCETLLGIAAGEIEVSAQHQLVAPILIRSQALATLYEAARRGEISAAEGMERVTRINSLKVRFLGDKVLQRQAWRIAADLGWDTTYDAEYIALTRLRADFLVTADKKLARAVSGIVETATADALRTS